MSADAGRHCSCSYLLPLAAIPAVLDPAAAAPAPAAVPGPDREASSENSPIALHHTPSPPLHLHIYFAVLFFRRGRNYSYSDSTLLRAFGFNPKPSSVCFRAL